MKKWLGLAVLGVAAAAWAAGTGTIEGTVTDGGGKVVPGAACAVGGKSATSDGGGRFTLQDVPAGPQTVRCSKGGLGSATARVTVPEGGVAKVSVKLRPVKKAEEVDSMLGALSGGEAAGRAASRTASGRAAARAERRVRRPSAKVKRKAMAPPPRPRPAPVAIAVAEPAPTPHDTEEYAHSQENDFRSPLTEPLSTFSIDVDTAAYANVRSMLNSSRFPPADAVRIEEFVNYFDYDYPDPRGPHPFGVNAEISVAPWNPKHRLVHIGLQGKKIDTAALPPANLVFLLDVSGSMNNWNKLPLLKQAFKLLVNNMRPQDQVAIVVYAGAAGLVLPSTPAKQRGKILEALDRLGAGGSTAGGAGIKLAYQVAREHFIRGGNNRIILATDGDFNVGTSSTGELTRLIEQERESGVFLTILGFGRGNYKDSRMEELSNKGNGNAAYIDSILEANKVLVREMGGTLLTIAKDVKIQVEFNPAHVKGYRLIGYENRALANQDFADDKKDAGELGAGHTVTVLYEIIPAGSDEEVKGAAPLKYQKKAPASGGAGELMTVKLRYKKPDGDKSTLIEHPLKDAGVALDAASVNFRFSAAVAAFAMLLRDSKHKGDASWDGVVALAKGALGKDRFGYRVEFLQLVEKAKLLKSTR